MRYNNALKMISLPRHVGVSTEVDIYDNNLGKLVNAAYDIPDFTVKTKINDKSHTSVFTFYFTKNTFCILCFSSLRLCCPPSPASR